MRNWLGEILVKKGILTHEQLGSLLKLQKESGRRLGNLVVESGFASESEVLEALSLQLDVPLYDLRSDRIDPGAAAMVTEDLARRYNLLPVSLEAGERLVVAMADPLDLNAIEEVELMTGMTVSPVLDSRDHILEAIHLHFSRQRTEKALEELDQDIRERLVPEEESEQGILQAPAIRLASSVIRQAVIQGASDIHIEPLEDHVRVRIRVNGELTELIQSPLGTHSIMVARFKILGHMNIAEHRIPQDGRTTLMVEGREIDLRLSTLPTVNGEKVVIRILDHQRLEQIRRRSIMNADDAAKFRGMINQSSGMVLVTGPTGSGKTTTLYSALRDLNKESRNIITIEDPVEYRLSGINQSQVNNKAGYTFANGLRAILRQDPNVIMVGEIRDVETAQIAIRAAITGHLVLSTMHTRDTAGTVSRLLDMGVESHLLSSALRGVVAQRLIRRVCEACKDGYEADSEEKRLLGMDNGRGLMLFKGRGCSQCGNTGYQDRFAIYELLPVYREIRDLIHMKASDDEIRDKARQRYGLVTLRETLVRMILEGKTTTEELHKVTSVLEE